jgi:hypothetical protein
MTDTTYTPDEVQGFVAQVSAFYSELSDTERRIFTDMLVDGVLSADTQGFAISDEPMPTSTISEALSEFLLAR